MGLNNFQFSLQDYVFVCETIWLQITKSCQFWRNYVHGTVLFYS